jgi:hypothetical protein
MAMAGAALTLAAGSAQAGCNDDVHALRAKLQAVKDEPKRLELARLLDKAEKDAQAGRTALCEDAVQHAQALLK